MDNMNKQTEQKEYEKYVKEITPSHNLGINMAKAFLTGGLICTAGRGLQICSSGWVVIWMRPWIWCSVTLVFISVLLTGLNIYPKIGKFGGAGSLVAITGFANSVAAPAIEYKAEGQVFGIGCKIFTIAGPVILYGILSSWCLGIIYYILKMIGVAS